MQELVVGLQHYFAQRTPGRFKIIEDTVCTQYAHAIINKTQFSLTDNKDVGACSY